MDTSKEYINICRKNGEYIMNEILDSSRIDMPIESNNYDEAYKRYLKQFTPEERLEKLLVKLLEKYPSYEPLHVLMEFVESDIYDSDVNEILKEIYFTKPGE